MKALLPFLLWRTESSLLLCLGLLKPVWAIHHLHWLSLGHHPREAAHRVAHHFLASDEIVGANQLFLLVLSSLLGIALLVSWVHLLLLALDVHRRVRSDAVLRWSWRWLWTVCALLTHHLCLQAARATNQVVVLLKQTERVRRWPIHTLVQQTLSVGTCRSFLSCSRSQPWCWTSACWSKTALPTLVSFTRAADCLSTC